MTTVGRPAIALGQRVYGLGMLALGVVCLVWKDLILGEQLPGGLPGRTALICATGTFLLIVSAAIEWRPFAAWGAAVLTVYTLIMMILLDGTPLREHYKEFGAYFGLAEKLAITSGGLIVYADSARISRLLSLRLRRVGRMTFGACALFFGAAHFVFMNLTAPLVPKWLPPSQVIWGYTTGVCFLASGIAILTGVQARLAAILLTVMLACFTLLVHVRILAADHSGVFNWSELALNVTILGAAWIVADSLAGPQRCTLPADISA